jgi:hypothetical protein
MNRPLAAEDVDHNVVDWNCGQGLPCDKNDREDAFAFCGGERGGKEERFAVTCDGECDVS